MSMQPQEDEDLRQEGLGHGEAFDLNKYRITTADGIGEVFYIPEFVTEDEEAYLTRQINDAPKPKWKMLANRRLQIWGGEVTSNRLIPAPLPPFLNKYPDIISRIQDTGAFSGSKHGQPNHVIVNEYLPGQGIMPHEDGPAYHPVVATISLGSHAVFHYYRYALSEGPDSTPGPESGVSGDGRIMEAKTGSGGERPDKAASVDAGAVEGAGSGSKAGMDGVGRSQSGTSRGRAMDRIPVLSVLLEPRSVVITRGSLYTGHLHGIDEVTEDKFVRQGDSISYLLRSVAAPSTGTDAGESPGRQRTVAIANSRLLDEGRLRVVKGIESTLSRDTRVSLTCRDVERVVNVGVGRLKTR